MTKVQATPSKIACSGALAGMLLLGLAATLVVMTPKPLAVEIEQRIEKEGRRLQVAQESPNTVMSHNLFYTAGSSWSTMMIQFLFGCCFAFLYKKNTVDKIEAAKGGTLADFNLPETGEDDFSNGICDCFSDPWVCIHGICCPLVRMAHTNAVAGVMGFWETIIVMFCCAALTGFGPCCMAVYFRRELKSIMGIEDHLFFDFLVTCCLPNLSICQSATAVDTKLGYEVTGCCDLEFVGPDYA